MSSTLRVCHTGPPLAFSGTEGTGAIQHFTFGTSFTFKQRHHCMLLLSLVSNEKFCNYVRLVHSGSLQAHCCPELQDIRRRPLLQ